MLAAPARGDSATAPDATERIGYKIPVIAQDGDLVGFAAQTRHLSLYTMSPDLVESMKQELAGYKVSGATLHFSPDSPLPDDLVRTIVRARLAENAARRAT